MDTNILDTNCASALWLLYVLKTPKQHFKLSSWKNKALLRLSGKKYRIQKGM